MDMLQKMIRTGVTCFENAIVVGKINSPTSMMEVTLIAQPRQFYGDCTFSASVKSTVDGRLVAMTEGEHASMSDALTHMRPLEDDASCIALDVDTRFALYAHRWEAASAIIDVKEALLC